MHICICTYAQLRVAPQWIRTMYLQCCVTSLLSKETWIDAERAVKKIAQRKAAPEIDCSE